MSIAASASQFIEIFTRFYKSKPEEFFTSGVTFNDWDGPSVPETLSMLQFLRTTFEPLISSGEINVLSKTTFNGLMGQIQSINNTYTQLTQSRDQSSFQNFANTVDQFAYHTRMFGIPLLAAGGAQIETLRLAFAQELQILTKNNTEVEELKKAVRTLITPAIAGSLSEAFQQRRDAVYKGRLVWLTACVLLGLVASYATFDFVHAVSAAAAPRSTTSPDQSLSLWVVIAIRTVVLVPLFAGFGFAFAQYKKERDFEEEYAHKAAVANSLPNYGELARDHVIRDQIVTAATAVIFSSPSEQARKMETSNAMLGSFKEVVDAMSKALAKK